MKSGGPVSQILWYLPQCAYNSLGVLLPSSCPAWTFFSALGSIKTCPTGIPPHSQGRGNSTDEQLTDRAV